MGLVPIIEIEPTMMHGNRCLWICLLLLNFMILHGAKSQDIDSTWKNSSKIDSSVTIYSRQLKPHGSYSYRIQFQLKDTLIQRIYSDSVNHPFQLLHTPSNLNIQHLNDSIWYLYGTRVEYAPYPFIFRTTNSGASWETIMESWTETKIQYENAYKNMDEKSFHMFDQMKGIWIVRLQNNKVDYRITNDGGFTWKNRSFRVKNGSKLKNGSSDIDVKYSEDNSVQISICGYLKSDDKWTKVSVIPVYSSNDFGRKFKALNKTGKKSNMQ